MSGHSKWAQIKRKKAATDDKRGRMFGKLLRAIEVAARDGGANVEGNMTLASAVQKARDYSVPVDNIERAIKRGAGETGDARYEEVVYEGYGPGGVAILVETMTDNRNRTGQEVRHTFTRLGGNLGDPGSVAWMFHRRGLIAIEKATAPDEERLFQSEGLNRAFVFKFPRFEERRGDAFAPEPPQSTARPIETGLYVPYDEHDADAAPGPKILPSECQPGFYSIACPQ